MLFMYKSNKILIQKKVFITKLIYIYKYSHESFKME